MLIQYKGEEREQKKTGRERKRKNGKERGDKVIKREREGEERE